MADPNTLSCALSGLTPTDEEITLAAETRDDKPDIPVGWMKLTLEMRGGNPLYNDIQQVKAGLVEEILGQTPEDQREAVRPVFEMQIDAQFAALENRPEHAMTMVDKVEIFIAPAHRNEGLRSEIQKLMTLLDIQVDLGGESTEDSDPVESSTDTESAA